MKNYYSDYVGHMMRQYLKLKDSDTEDVVLKNNIDTCKAVVDKLPEAEKAIILQVYSDKILTNSINVVAEENGIRSQNVWMIVKNFEREVAKERGLI